MKLTLHTDYALRTLLYLTHRAARGTGRPSHRNADGQLVDAAAPATVDAIAEAFSISREHLVKVVQKLARLGYVSTRAGRGGGMSLACDPAKLRVSEVVAAFEGRQQVLECLLKPEVCVLEPGCDLRRLLIQAEQAFYDTLATKTIADLARPKGRKGGVHNLVLRT
ncbi:MAG: RrF2 family transcriptional regulator [Planctomycetota bacterium]